MGGFDDSLNMVAVQGIHTSECHCFYVMAKDMKTAMDNPEYVKDAAVKAALMRVFELSLLQNIRESGGDFAATLDAANLRRVTRRINELLAQIRPDAVALVDGFALADDKLASTLGRHDGNVYEAIYNEAKLNPLNGNKMVGWEHIAPQMDMDFMREGMQWQRQGATAESKL